MSMIDFEVGTVPTRPLTIVVRDEMDNPVNLIAYSGWELEMRGSDDEKVDLTGSSLVAVPQTLGVLAFNWPSNRSLFNKKGKYVLRLVLKGAGGGKDITRTAEISVREFGRIR